MNAPNSGQPPAVGPPAAEPGESGEPDLRRRFYLTVATKFLVSTVFAAGWTGLAVWLSQPWIADLSLVVGPVLAWVMVALTAYLPGLVVALLAMSLLLDRQPRLRVLDPDSPVTVIIAALNEERGIAATIRGVARSEYAGPISIILADNGSTDATVAVALDAAAELDIDLTVIREQRPGKSHALNRALVEVTTACVITVDADTILHREALRRLMSRFESSAEDTVAIAGSVLVRNSRINLLTKMQEWDYYLGIAGVKRMQGLYQSILVAQGAFSVYLTDAVREVGGWPDAIGEDIVVTWRLMQSGRRVVFEPTAVAFTNTPTTTVQFFRQRARWARGMFEGIRAVPPWRQKRVLTRFVAGIDLLIPLLDVGYALVWLPGLVLAILGYPIIVSVWTLAVLPITLLVYGLLRHYQSNKVFGPLGLTVRRNRLGYIAFLLVYQVICSVAALTGYAQFISGTTRRWK